MDNTIPVDITPDKSLIQKLGLVGYRTEQAIAELLDNSIDARILDKEEKIEVHLDFKDKWIGVKDNGHGMNKDDLTNAMTIAKGTKADGKLGQFGIGMKSACSALGKKFVIVTSKIDSDKEYRVEYDEKTWLNDESKNWRNFIITEKTLSPKDNWHGTRITVSNLKIPLYPNQVSNFKENFGMRYFPYLETNQALIQINTVYCKPEKPDVVEGSKKNIQILLPSGKTITGYVALLKKRSIKGHYGLNLFRNGRLIKAFEKFGFTAHPENAKIIGELNLDHVPVNFNKSEFIPSSEYEEAENAFKTSKEFKDIYHSSRSKGETIVSVESVFDYFNNNTPPQYLERSVRSKVSKELLDGTEPFEMKIGRNLAKIGIKSLENAPLYTVKKQNSHINVIINKDDESFRFVKNPLFLIGMIASEIKLLSEYPNFEELIYQRNNDLKKFLNQWAEKPKTPEIREREVKIPKIKHYKLNDELVDLHDFLQVNCGFKFQFTALSTLAPYLHNLRGKLVYTLHTTPNKGEYVTDILSQEFRDQFAIVNKPDLNSLNTLLNMPNIDRIIAVREYSVIKGSTIATPEKAFVDLIVEIYTHDIPLDKTELRRIFQTMMRYDLINVDELRRYGNFVKKSSHVEQLLEETRNG